MLNLICRVDSGLQKHENFFLEFTKILQHQVDQVPEDLFVDIIDSDNLVRHLLDIYFQNVQSKPEGELVDLKLQVSLLKRHVENKFNWRFELELDDELPVIVET